jgi:hypothetical protein
MRHRWRCVAAPFPAFDPQQANAAPSSWRGTARAFAETERNMENLADEKQPSKLDAVWRAVVAVLRTVAGLSAYEKPMSLEEWHRSDARFEGEHRAHLARQRARAAEAEAAKVRRAPRPQPVARRVAVRAPRRARVSRVSRVARVGTVRVAAGADGPPPPRREGHALAVADVSDRRPA